MVDASQDENKEHRRIWELKNTKRAKRRQNAKNYARNPLYHRNLNNALAAAEDREYRTPINAIAKAALIVQQLQPNQQVQRLQYLTLRMLMQLDEQNPMSSTWNTLSRSECHGDSAQVSCTPGGGLRPQGGDNCQRNQDNQGDHGNWQGQQSTCGNIDQEVQQPPRPLCSQHTARPQCEA
jgi:hypothetical protein